MEEDGVAASAGCDVEVVDADEEVAIVAGVDDAVSLGECLVGVVDVAVLKVGTLRTEC